MPPTPTKMNDADPVPPQELPSLQPYTGAQPQLPAAFQCTAILHPFSPPLAADPNPPYPFYQLCTANIAYQAGQYFSAQITGCSYGTWWYWVDADDITYLSLDEGATWNTVVMGWTLPANSWFGGQAAQAACAGTSYLNWMQAQEVNWWKIPVPLPPPPPSLNAATWMWFDANTDAPVRMMFGQGPAQGPLMGDPTQLALFQMFSFTYFPSFQWTAPAPPLTWSSPQIEGFACGNPPNYTLFTWNEHFGMTVFMTPVNEAFNPLPTRVLYQWAEDGAYQVYTDRAQSTLMWNTYNSPPMVAQEALLTGPAPNGVPPPQYSDAGFLITYNETGTTCVSGADFPFPEEPPYWAAIPAEQGTIQAVVSNNPVVSPSNNVMIVSVLFPPSPPNYPEATYLWTWYSPFPGSDGSHSRPVTFMQSQSGVGVGTSLALADYFYYQEYGTPIDPSNFAIPPAELGLPGELGPPGELG